MKTENQLLAVARSIRTLLLLILIVLLVNVGYSATRFGKTELGETLGVTALILAAVLLFCMVLHFLANLGSWFNEISDEATAEKKSETKADSEAG